MSQHYPPEMGALAGRAAELSRHWALLGHRASVLTAFPNHPTGVVIPEYRDKFKRLFYREQVDGVDVVRTWLLPYPNRRPIERVLNYGSFCLSASVRGAFLQRPDVVIGTSPPLPIAIAGYNVARVKRVPFIFEVRDLWPESLEGVGLGAEHSRIYKVVASIVRFLYRHSDHIVVVTPAFKDYLNSIWGVPMEKMSIVVNGVETERFVPASRQAQILREFGIPEGKFVASYIGTMGMAHGLETVLEVAELLQQSSPEILLLLVGEGGNREQLVQIARERQLTNVIFTGQQPREKIPAIINSSDLCLALLKNQEVFKTVIPTKMLEFMSCGRPVVLGVGGQAERILREADAGISVEAENPAAIAEAIRTMYAQPELRERFGRNGRAYILAKMSREQTARQYLDVLANLTGKSAIAQPLAANPARSGEGL
ncbi:MAG TPA: glycosyltransferase family 4 protein [Terriglobales bacterium]|nr:glycosyltransferase family 4 protein [Terriglobales bacterium]